MQFTMPGGGSFALGRDFREGLLRASFRTFCFIGPAVSCVTLQRFARSFLPAVLLRGNPMKKLDRCVLAYFGVAAIVLAGSAFGAQQPQGPKTYSLKPTPKTGAWGSSDASTTPALLP